ncbi:LLM class F420-dependent oxidoreductase [Candidatus Poriferisocius sp.]|uniref:LLM class F420-dependent oxidoreductase n=1 Tax=Candidatus Poriferisocius sp. TaxID=3101276 RepID=UPI003B58E1DA
MKFAVTYPMVGHPWDPKLITKQGLAAFARTAEESGFHGMGFTDHPCPTDRWLKAGGHDALDPFAALAFCAAITDRIKLIPNIVVVPYRNPFIMAKSIATVDVLSGGRFVFATGAGYLKGEFKALGVDFDNRNRIYDEALEAMIGVWTTDDFAFEASTFTALGQTANPKPVQEPHPPIWIGGNSKRARRRVAAFGNGWTPFPAPRVLATTAKTPPLETLDDLSAMLDELWTYVDEAGRDPADIDVSYLNNEGGPPSSEDFDAEAHIAGLAELEALGVTWITVNVPGHDIEHTLDTMRRYGESVIAPAQPR